MATDNDSPWGSTDCLESLQLASGPGPRQSVEALTGLSEGTNLGGYRLVRRIGSGNQAEVWEALPANDKAAPIALRVLRADHAHAPPRKAAFLRSAALTSRLRADSLLATLAIGEAGGTAYQALPLVRGADLAEAIASRREGIDTTPERAWWGCRGEAEYQRVMTVALAGVASALAHAHSNGVAHRDVKPANILLDLERPCRAVLADFGVGSDASKPNDKGRRSGTPMYMAPERLLGLPADDMRGDVFALGATLYEALTLSRPRTAPEGTHRALVPAILAASRPRPPRSVCPTLSLRVESVILKAMAPEPVLRYPDARAMADDLERAARAD